MAKRIDLLKVLDEAVTAACEWRAMTFTGDKWPEAWNHDDDAIEAVRTLVAAAKAVCGDTPPAGQPGHIDFADALVVLQQATEAFR